MWNEAVYFTAQMVCKCFAGYNDVTNQIPSQNEKTIMLVGATGTGKSTLLDGLVNYILGIGWNDPFRFTIIDLEDDKKRKAENQVAKLHFQ